MYLICSITNIQFKYFPLKNLAWFFHIPLDERSYDVCAYKNNFGYKKKIICLILMQRIYTYNSIVQNSHEWAYWTVWVASWSVWSVFLLNCNKHLIQEFINLWINYLLTFFSQYLQVYLSLVWWYLVCSRSESLFGNSFWQIGHVCISWMSVWRFIWHLYDFKLRR